MFVKKWILEQSLIEFICTLCHLLPLEIKKIVFFLPDYREFIPYGESINTDNPRL
jgi:hypothetical protein